MPNKIGCLSRCVDSSPRCPQLGFEAICASGSTDLAFCEGKWRVWKKNIFEKSRFFLQKFFQNTLVYVLRES